MSAPWPVAPRNSSPTPESAPLLFLGRYKRPIYAFAFQRAVAISRPIMGSLAEDGEGEKTGSIALHPVRPKLPLSALQATRQCLRNCVIEQGSNTKTARASHRASLVNVLGATLDRLDHPAQRVVMIVADLHQIGQFPAGRHGAIGSLQYLRHGYVVLLAVANDRVSHCGALFGAPRPHCGPSTGRQPWRNDDRAGIPTASTTPW